MLSFVYDPKREIIDFVMSARIFVFMILFSFQYVFGEEIDRESKIKLPYYFYHYSECKEDELLIDSLVSCYDMYSIEQQNLVADFIVDSAMSKRTSYLIESFFLSKINISAMSKRQKDKLMERTISYLTPNLLEFWVKLQDRSYTNILHEWWKSSENLNDSFYLEYALFKLGDIEVINKWMNVMETATEKHDILDYDYYIFLKRIMLCPRNKVIYDRLIGIMLKFPDKLMRIDYEYYKTSDVYETLFMFIYRDISKQIKNAPNFWGSIIRIKNENGAKYYEYPEKYMQKCLNWIKEHIDDYEFVER